MAEIIKMGEAARELGRNDRVVRELGIERAQVGRGAPYHVDVGSTARAVASDYVARPHAFGPRGWPQVGGVMSAKDAAEALVLHSAQTPLIRATLLTYHEDLSKLGLTDPRANPEGMDEVLARLVHQIQHYHPEALEVLHKRTRAVVFDPLDLTSDDSRVLVANWLDVNGNNWLDLVLDEYGQRLPEDNAAFRSLVRSFWPTSEAAAVLPRWSLSEEEASDAIDEWLEGMSDTTIAAFFDIQHAQQ